MKFTKLFWKHWLDLTTVIAASFGLALSTIHYFSVAAVKEAMQQFAGIQLVLLLAGTLSGIILGFLFGRLLHREKPTVFLSYIHDDAIAAQKINRFLSKKGIRILDDSILQVGDNIESKILDFINDSDCLIAIISINSKRSDWFRKEIELAKKNEKRVLPILIEPTSLPEYLKEYVYADLTVKPQKALQDILKAILPKENGA